MKTLLLLPLSILLACTSEVTTPVDYADSETTDESNTEEENSDEDTTGDNSTGDNNAGDNNTGDVDPGDDEDDEDDEPTEDSEEDPTDWEDSSDLPAFVDDCATLSNETRSTASGLSSQDGTVYSGVQLCANDMDVYRVDVPAGLWLSVSIDIDGSGQGTTDLDMYELDHPSTPLPSSLDMVDDSYSENIVWYSYAEIDYEALAWYNPTNQTRSHYIAIAGYNGAIADYDLTVQTSDYHEGLDCDAFYSNTSESGPCNEIMLFPQADDTSQGYAVSHNPHYSHLRREVAYLVQYAASETSAMFPGTNPLGLLDMGEADGSTPGAMVGSLRHPEGTHVYGNDIDIAYYQTGSDNLGRTVCPDDGYFCTSAPTILDARRTAYFMVKLMESPNLRVIGVDTMIATELLDAADQLLSEGKITNAQRARLESYMAYGEGWPFHQHHMHFSWQWEDGHTYSDTTETGCLLEDVEDYETPQIGGAW